MRSGVKYAASWLLAPLGFSILDQITEAATMDEEVKWCVKRYWSHEIFL